MRLQYMFGLAALGVDWLLLQYMTSTGDEQKDRRLIKWFLRRMSRYGFRDRVAVIVFPIYTRKMELDNANVHGMSPKRLREQIRSADVLWNLCSVLRGALLSEFRRKVLVDLDPGHLHVSALSSDVGVDEHDVHFTIGLNVNVGNALIPRLGVSWIPIRFPAYLPMWKGEQAPSQDAPFTSVTQWTWGGELPIGDRRISVSKREGYLRYLTLPTRVSQPFELAVNLDDPDDVAGQRALLTQNGWRVVDPHVAARTPARYRKYLRDSRAEISCPKPVYRELQTGWFGDRSVAYLANGRPVLAEDTGFSGQLPTGEGLVSFRDLDEAVAGVEAINSDYERHRRAARDIAEEFFDSRIVLKQMLEAS